MDEHISNLDPANFKKMIAEACRMYPNFKAVATTLRNAKTATLNDWGAILWTDGAILPGTPAREPGDLRPRRRRRQLRLRDWRTASWPAKRRSRPWNTARRTARWP